MDDGDDEMTPLGVNDNDAGMDGVKDDLGRVMENREGFDMFGQ